MFPKDKWICEKWNGNITCRGNIQHSRATGILENRDLIGSHVVLNVCHYSLRKGSHVEIPKSDSPVESDISIVISLFKFPRINKK